MNEIMANPLYYWAAVIGLISATAIILSSAFFMMGAAFKTMNLIRMRSYRRKMGELLERIYYANKGGDEKLSDLAKTLLENLDPKRAALIVKITSTAEEDGK